MSNAAFKRQYAAILAKAGARAELVVRQSAVALQSGMVEKSPVGDPSQWKNPTSAPPGYVGGRFKGNWQTGIGVINADISAAPDKSGNGSIARALATVQNWKAGQTIFLTNSLPYAAELERGSSTQAPTGVVRLTVMDFQRTVAQIAAGLR